MGSGVQAIAMVALALSSITCALATEYVIGEDFCSQPAWHFGCTYDLWAQNHKFTVGDTLVFNFDVEESTVAQVTKLDYEECISGLTPTANPAHISSKSPLTIPLSETGTFFFVSIVGRNCHQKVAITVVETSWALKDSSSSSSHQSSLTSSNASAVKAVVGFLVAYAFVVAMVLLQDLLQDYFGIGFF